MEAYLTGGPKLSPRTATHVTAPSPCTPKIESPRVMAPGLRSVFLCQPFPSLIKWKVRQTCVGHGTGGGLVLIEATPTLWARPRCSHHERLISSTVRAFHHIMGPNPGRFASHYGSQPSSPSPRQTPACLQDEKLSKLLGVGCT